MRKLADCAVRILPEKGPTTTLTSGHAKRAFSEGEPFAISKTLQGGLKGNRRVYALALVSSLALRSCKARHLC